MKFATRLLACLVLLAGGTLRASNDSFAEATDLSAVSMPYVGWVGGTGTAEAGEPAHAGAPAANSYWFQWKCPLSSPCIFREYMNGSASRIAIYTGETLATLILVAEGKERVFFPANAGVRYHIAIDSPSSDVVQFKPYPVGGADDIADAEPITGTLPLKVKGNNALATVAPTDVYWGPPESHLTATVWWVWTAPTSGAVRLDARYCDFYTRLTAYERAPGGSPVLVGQGFEATGMTVTAGNDYLFCIDTLGDPGEIGFWMEWFPTTVPPNDNVANATDLGSSLVACDGEWIRYATAQAGVPGETVPSWGGPPDHTLWWKWTCPQSGTYRFSQLGSDGYASINVYTGSAALLGIVAGLDDRNGVRIAVTAGTTYWIQINDWKKYQLRAELNIHPAATDPEPSYFAHFADRGYFRLYGRQRHPDADPDGDGFSNELEFACGANPEVHAPEDLNLPHLLPNGSGWKLQWGVDSGYVTLPITLTGKVAESPSGPWVNTAIYSDSIPGRKLLHLPTLPRAFARMELNDPSWNPAP